MARARRIGRKCGKECGALNAHSCKRKTITSHRGARTLLRRRLSKGFPCVSRPFLKIDGCYFTQDLGAFDTGIHM